MNDELITRARTLCGTLDGQLRGCWERGAHPRATPLSLHHGHELAYLIRDLAIALHDANPVLGPILEDDRNTHPLKETP